MAKSNGHDPLDLIHQRLRVLAKITDSLQKQIDLQGRDIRELRINDRLQRKEIEALKKRLQSPNK